MPRASRSVAVLALVCVLVLAGCSGGGGAGGGNASGSVELAASSDGGGAGSAGGGATVRGEAVGAQADTQLAQRGRARIRTGYVRLDVENFTTARRNLTRATRQQGGYVSASRATTRRVAGENVTSGRLVLRVPRRNFAVLLARVEATGTVRDRRTNTTDVSGRLVDLRARLNNSRAQRERLRSLYADANDTAATLKVQRRLSTVQSRIERLQGQLQSLRNQIAYSTITVELGESAPEQRGGQWYDAGVLDAFLASIGGVVTTLQAMVVALAYLGPYLLVFGLPVAAVGYAAYRRRRAS